MKKYIYNKVMGAAMLCLLLLTSCDKDVFNIGSDPFEGTSFKAMSSSPISTYLDSVGVYNEYVKALKYADMFNALNQASDGVSFTAFVPTNEAMQKFYASRNVSSLEELSKEYVRQFVLYHTLKDSLTIDQFITAKSVKNLMGDELRVEIDPLSAGEANLGEDGRVSEMGLSTANGKVFILSHAVKPLVETLYDRISDQGNSKIMMEAISEAGWAKKLQTISDTTVQQGVSHINYYNYTLLNVTDDAFAKAGIASLDQLKGQLKNADERGLTVDSLLREYVGYHILPGAYKTSQLGEVSGSSLTRILGTSAKNQVMTVTTDVDTEVEADKYVINAEGESAKFIPLTSNVRARNGYLHNITAWLPVWTPRQEVVLWDLADNNEVRNIVIADENNTYQPEEFVSSEKSTDITKATGTFTYELGPSGTLNNTYHPISYVSCGKNWQAANKHDRVVFNVGAQGSVSMPTPTIVRGKYKVTLQFAYTTSHSFMRTQSGSNGGKIIMTFDGDHRSEVAPYTTVTSALPGMYTCTLYDEIEFDETASHVFRFIVNDQAASTNKGFSLQFDYIMFEPITE